LTENARRKNAGQATSSYTKSFTTTCALVEMFRRLAIYYYAICETDFSSDEKCIK